MPDSKNYPLEFYGRLVSEVSKGSFLPVFQAQLCPFTKRRCIKLRKSDPTQTIGACIVGYQGTPLIICPHRFMQHYQIFLDTLPLLTPGSDYYVLPEVTMPGGAIDYFLLSTRGAEILDYAGIEIQSLDTTGSGGIWRAREDLLQGRLAETYPYGINWKKSAKTILVQMLHKAAAFEALGKKLVLVIQQKFFDYLAREFQTSQLQAASNKDPIQFHIYDLVLLDASLHLALRQQKSTDIRGIERMLNLGRESGILEQEILARIGARMPTALRLEVPPDI